MTARTRGEIASAIDTQFLDNTDGQITPERLRTVTTDLADSAVFPGDDEAMSSGDRQKLGGLELADATDIPGATARNHELWFDTQTNWQAWRDSNRYEPLRPTVTIDPEA